MEIALRSGLRRSGHLSIQSDLHLRDDIPNVVPVQFNPLNQNQNHEDLKTQEKSSKDTVEVIRGKNGTFKPILPDHFSC